MVVIDDVKVSGASGTKVNNHLHLTEGRVYSLRTSSQYQKLGLVDKHPVATTVVIYDYNICIELIPHFADPHPESHQCSSECPTATGILYFQTLPSLPKDRQPDLNQDPDVQKSHLQWYYLSNGSWYSHSAIQENPTGQAMGDQLFR